MRPADLLARVPILGGRVIDLARRIRYPAAEQAVRDDYQRTVDELRWLRQAMPPLADSAKRLFIVSLSDMVYQLKLEGMIAAALRLHGWRPVVLTNSKSNTRALRYFRAFGVDDFVFVDDYAPTREDRRNAWEQAAAFLSGDMGFRTVKSWKFAQSWIGPQILSTVSRIRHEGAPDPRDPRTRAEIEAMLPALLERVLVARRVVADQKPDLGLVIEANYVLNSPFIDALVAKGVGIVQAVQPWRDDALTLWRLTAATRRVHPSSVAPDTFARLLGEAWGERQETELTRIFADRYNGAWFLQARNQPRTSAFANDEILRRLDFDPAKKTATVFSHVLWDANLFYGDDLFEDYGDWFVETVRAAARNASLNWIIKLHPANLWKRTRDGADGEFSELSLIRDRIGELPPHVRILTPDTDISTDSLFDFTSYGVTVRGTTGMELPCFGKPTLTAGTGRYSGLGFTVDSSSREEYLGHLARLHEMLPMSADAVDRARRHAHAAFIRRPWRMSSFRSKFDYRSEGPHALDHNLACVARSLDEARSNGDLDRLAHWAGSDSIDYLND